MLQPVLLGGVFIGILSALPVVSLANCCCIWIVGGGMLAAYLDQSPGRPNNLPRGALDGLLAGIVGAIVWLFAAMAVDMVMSPLQDRMLGAVLSGPYDLPPEVRAWFDEIERHEGGLVRYAIGFMFLLGAGVIFGTLGGLLGALFFWRDGLPPALGGPQPPPPIPPQM